MNPQDLSQLFKGQFIGMVDMDGTPIHEGDSVQFYYKGELATCKVVYVPARAMFFLQWPDGYTNKVPMTPERYRVIK